nr:hypothetical protein [Pseudofrankia asymbiotica]
MTADEAAEHAARGGSVWDWAGTEVSLGRDTDVVLVGIGDAPTVEILAAAELPAQFVPSLAVRVVNVIDLMALLRPDLDAGIKGIRPRARSRCRFTRGAECRRRTPSSRLRTRPPC